MGNKRQLATLIYIDNGSSYLMLHRNKREEDVHYGKWIAVGGKVENNETVVACAIREVFEETGLSVNDIQELGVITFVDFTPNTDWIVYIFKATNFYGDIIDSREGMLSWVKYEDLLSLPTWQGDYIFNKWILENREYFQAEFIYNSGEFQSYTVTFGGNNGSDC